MSLSGWGLSAPVVYNQLVAASAVALSKTGDTNETALVSVALPPLGPNDQVRITALWTYTNSANAKTLRIKLGPAAGTSGTSYLNGSATTSAAFRTITEFANRGATNSQVGGQATGGIAQSGSANITTSVDTSVTTYLNFCVTLANGTETITLEQYRVEIIRVP